MKIFQTEKYFLIFRVLPFVFGISIFKVALHFLGFEFFSLSPLVTSLVTANVFLLGFLIGGTLTDYKESERLPGELAASLETISDEVKIIYQNKKNPVAKECLEYLIELNKCMLDWFQKDKRTKELMRNIEGLNKFFLAFEQVTQANFIVRLKQEQNFLRRQVIRIHTIRETSFVPAGYVVAEIVTFLLIFSLLISKIEPFYESLFSIGIISFLLIYMLFLIKELDNPFSHYEKNKMTSRVSLKPLEDSLNSFEQPI